MKGDRKNKSKGRRKTVYSIQEEEEGTKRIQIKLQGCKSRSEREKCKRDR